MEGSLTECDQADWFFIGNTEEASTQTLPSLPDPVSLASAATQTFQDLPEQPVPSRIGYVVAGAALLGLGLAAGRYWAARAPEGPASQALVSVEGQQTQKLEGEAITSPSSEPLPVNVKDTKDGSPKVLQDWGEAATPSLPALESSLEPALSPSLGAFACDVPPASTSCEPADKDMNAAEIVPVPDSVLTQVEGKQASRYNLQGAAVIGLGLTAFAAAGLLSRTLWCKGANMRQLCAARQVGSAQHERLQGSLPTMSPAPKPTGQAGKNNPVGNGTSKAQHISSFATPCGPSSTKSHGIMKQDASDCVDIDFAILAKSRLRPAATQQAEVYILDGIVRPVPPTSSRVFRMLPKQ
ncbi:linD [Symbiodinium sp. CCMP2592]|nr:linD [Symbiodinium sp. CCMP2592]